ncbi:MAG TPA: hypothetical protein VG733_06450, partial [Chthoniobacteraceae bacterium]|nr:hypothetical protein [Chthoniobacteraceae bacterium]
MKRLAAGIHIAFCCSVALAWPLESSLALDLTPHAGVLQGNEGPATPILEFTNGSKKITWVAPHDWIADGGGKSLSLSAPGGSTAWMKLIVAPIVKEDPQQPVTDPAAKPEDIEAWPRKYLPGGAQDVSFVKMVPSPFTV